MTRAGGHTSVMADKASAKAIEAEADPERQRHLALNYFPTPPWATRALFEHVIPTASGTCWEPACGEGHMADVLAERFDLVSMSDVHDYGYGRTGSFVGVGADVIEAVDPLPDWIITNPPFSLAVEFAERALLDAREGVALLVRTSWLEGAGRWERLFRDQPPTVVAPFVERVPMVAGRWDPEASTATAYAWFVWRRPMCRAADIPVTRLQWIPPGCRDRLTRPGDVARFAGRGVAVEPGLFDEVAA